MGFKPTNLRSLGTSALPTHTMIRWLRCSCTGLNIIDSNELFTVLVWERGGGDPCSEKYITYTHIDSNELFTVLVWEGGGGDPCSEKYITYTHIDYNELFTVLVWEGGNGEIHFLETVREFSHQLVSPWPYSYVWLAPHVPVHQRGTLGQMASVPPFYCLWPPSMMP